MDTDILNPKQLFQKDVTYIVPPFQRRYVWRLDDQWVPLWEDIQHIAEDYLEKYQVHEQDELKAEQNTVKHFLGAIVIQQVATPTKDIDKREVIDGQQRLTTLLLLIDACQKICSDMGHKKIATRLSKFVMNDSDLVDGEDQDEQLFKIWPTKNDRDAFLYALCKEGVTHNIDESRIVQAHEFFQQQARLWLEAQNSDTPGSVEATEESIIRAKALEAAVSGRLSIAVIDLDIEDNQYMIFETLNARGTPLLESELIKNYVMSISSSDKAETIWGDLDEEWWRQDVRQGRLYRPRIDMLIDYWLESKTFKEVHTGHLFKTFQRLVDNNEVQSCMDRLTEDLQSYRKYEEGRRNEIEDTYHYRSNVVQMGAFTPLLLMLLRQPEDVRVKSLQILESFVIRRMICRETTKDYNRMVLELIAELNKNQGENVANIIRTNLQGQTTESRHWPTDKDIVTAFETLPLYRMLSRGRLRVILEAIESFYRINREVEQKDVPKNLTIEHVLPISWRENWPLTKFEYDANRADRRNKLLHTIGNLTLITGPVNTKASNKAWNEKRYYLEEHSILFLNKKLLKESKNQKWDEEFILKRSKRMAEIVLQIWPGPTVTH